MTISMNLNVPIQVKLTEKGRQHYLESHNKGLEGTKFYAMKESDIVGLINLGEGWYEFRLWDFMGLFGDVSTHGNAEKYYDINVKIGDKGFEEFCRVLGS